MAALIQLPGIETEAKAMLATEQPPWVRVRLLRDVLRVSFSDRALRFASRDLNLTPPVQQLWAEQHQGSWGRFHSRDRDVQQRIATTEAGVDRALELGLAPTHPLLRRVTGYLERLLTTRTPFPDPPENNSRWRIGWRLFTAATLAKIAPNHWAIDPEFELWSQIMQRTFARGRYDAKAELAAHRELTGLGGDLRYLQINNVYALTLLDARSAEVPIKTQNALLRWLFSRDKAMFYLPVSFRRQPSGKELPNTIRALEIVSGFPPWRSHAQRLVKSMIFIPRNELQTATRVKLLSLLRRYTD